VETVYQGHCPTDAPPEPVIETVEGVVGSQCDPMTMSPIQTEHYAFDPNYSNRTLHRPSKHAITHQFIPGS